jgi:hypothetical protein
VAPDEVEHTAPLARAEPEGQYGQGLRVVIAHHDTSTLSAKGAQAHRTPYTRQSHMPITVRCRS